MNLHRDGNTEMNRIIDLIKADLAALPDHRGTIINLLGAYVADEITSAQVLGRLSDLKLPVTPACPHCGHNDCWSISREVREIDIWDVPTQSLKSHSAECWERDVYCGHCGESADYENPIYQLLENA